ncbi:hypothetical protein HPC62_10070 [Thermoleptolyngbya sichuanensis A183]|uniref:Uncharacterized protein n=1 Tax=Thermoleptolyngbya sichuanensis A183 TaxID=2737172 RepID=A0A6M8B7P4_9CYAN|nr:MULTISPECIES: hypothetical protein [Thermoleptolyngbya]QKD82478.1 hypothetical protein HPC62_10070 [Thermoleptolyngbya sichuanensis A183]
MLNALGAIARKWATPHCIWLGTSGDAFGDQIPVEWKKRLNPLNPAHI